MNRFLTIVTCSMNRETYLEEVIESTRNLNCLYKHIIIDWSSDNKLSKQISFKNNKVEVVRVEKENSWWLTRAYNFGFSLAKTPYILKLDADTVLESNKLNNINIKNFDHIIFEQKNHGLGNFVIKKNLFDEIGGFNEFIWGWGYDDIDLFNRLKLNSKYKLKKTLFDGSLVKVIEHDNIDRFSNSDKYIDSQNKFLNNLASAHSSKNLFVAENTVWNKYMDKKYKNMDEYFIIEHFYSPKNLNFLVKIKRKYIFLKNLFNDFKFKKIKKFFVYLFLPIPDNIIRKIFKVNIYP